MLLGVALLACVAVTAASRCNATAALSPTKMNFYRVHRNDTFAKVIADNNAASILGEACWLCDGGKSFPLLTLFEITVDTRWCAYSRCNKGTCDCYNQDDCLGVGRTQPGDFSYQCQPSFNYGEWFSFPSKGYCNGTKVGVNNCTWSGYKPTKVIEVSCLLKQTSKLYPSGNFQSSCSWNNVAQINDITTIIDKGFANCPDVSQSVPNPPHLFQKLKNMFF